MQMTTTGFLPPPSRPLHPSHRLGKGASAPLFRVVCVLGREKRHASPVDLRHFHVTYVERRAVTARAVEECRRGSAQFEPAFLDKRMPLGIDRKEKARLGPHEQPVPISCYAAAPKIGGIS